MPTESARVTDSSLVRMVGLSAVLLSETVFFPRGDTLLISPEPLDPQRFGSSGSPTCESDSYALGMVIYEVNW